MNVIDGETRDADNDVMNRRKKQRLGDVKSIGNYLTGASSLLEGMMPRIFQSMVFTTKSKPSSFHDDFQALRGDWAAVGNDISTAMEASRQKLERNAQNQQVKNERSSGRLAAQT